jgi:hypothetical protein
LFINGRASSGSDQVTGPVGELINGNIWSRNAAKPWRSTIHLRHAPQAGMPRLPHAQAAQTSKASSSR